MKARAQSFLLTALVSALLIAPSQAARAEDSVTASATLSLPALSLKPAPALLSLRWLPGSAARLAVGLDRPGAKLVLEQNGQPVDSYDSPGAEAVFSLPRREGNFVAKLLDAQGKEIARGELKSPQAATTALQLYVNPNQVFGKSLSPLAVEAGPGRLQVLLDGQSIYSQEIERAGTQSLPPLPLSPGRHRLQLVLEGNTGRSSTPAVQIFSFGIEPLDHSYLLADKYNFTLYWIKEGALHRIYPVATGRPSLPTQPGFWLIGGKDVFFPASDWGSYRLRIYRENQYQTHWSGYAVHGTNRPTSIGTEASHGCLRMFNHHVTELYQGIKVGTPLLIEEKLPAYIETINE